MVVEVAESVARPVTAGPYKRVGPLGDLQTTRGIVNFDLGTNGEMVRTRTGSHLAQRPKSLPPGEADPSPAR